MTPETSSGQDGQSTAVDGLEDMLAAFDRDRCYTTQRLLKENEFERTELVVDAQGRRFIRKYISIDADGMHPYERLFGVEHPRLQRVCEVQRFAGKLVVVCAYVEGVNMREYVAARGRLNEREAAALLCDVCEALAVLHGMPGAAIVHRDVNPGNIVVSGGHACLIDLGIARSRSEGAARDTHAWGTQGYTAPEQFGFMQTDARADIYSVGQVLGFMLAGDGAQGTVPAKCAGALPPAMRGVYEKATRLDPDDRFQSVRELAAALREAAGLPAGASAGAGGAETHRPAPKKRSVLVTVCWRTWQVLAAIAAALITLGTLNAVRLDPAPLKIPGTLIMGLLCFAMPLVMSANLANVNDRIAWLQTNRRMRIVAIWLAAWGVFVVYAFIAIALGYDPNAART